MLRTIRGGQAVPLGRGFYYMRGRKHEQGGIDIGRNLEVEDGEVTQITPNSIKVFSAQPILNGLSPAQKVLRGNNPNRVFAEQENFKDKFNLKDDGSKKARLGIDVERYKTDVEYRKQIIADAQAHQSSQQAARRGTNQSKTIYHSPIFDDNETRIAASEQGKMDRVNKQIADKERIDNGLKEGVKFVAENIPIIGEGITLKDAYNDYTQGNTLAAGIGLGGLILPFGLNRLAKGFTSKILKRATKDTEKLLDWNGYSKGGPISSKHLEEYADIERQAKANGTWLKNADGTDFTDDPHIWVKMQSKDFKANYADRVLYSGTSKGREIKPDYDGLQFASDEPNRAITYANNDDYVETLAIKKGTPLTIFDANNSNWRGIYKDADGKIYNTNDFANSLPNGEYGDIKRVHDFGPKVDTKVHKQSKYYSEEDTQKFYDYMNEVSTDQANTFVFAPGSIRKDIKYNNGDFNPNINNKYMSIISPILGLGLTSNLLLNKTKDKKAMGGLVRVRPFTGARKKSVTIASLGTEEQVQQQRRLAQKPNTINALMFNNEHPDSEILPNVEVIATPNNNNNFVTLPSNTKFYGKEWNFSTIPQAYLRNGSYVRNSIPETIDEPNNTISDWELAGRYPFGFYRTPFRKYDNKILPIATQGDVDDRYSLFTNAGNNLGVRYPYPSLTMYSRNTPTKTTNNNTKTTNNNNNTNNTPAIRTGMVPFRPFTEELPEVAITAPANKTKDNSTPPVKGTSSTAGVKPTKPTKRKTSPVTTTEDYAERSDNFRIPGIADVGIASKITKSDVSPVAKPTNPALNTRTKNILASNKPTITNYNPFKNINTEEAVGLASNVLSSGISYLTNRRAINNMTPPSEPTMRFAPKLNTTVNINPQDDLLREAGFNIRNNVTQNTASSNVARNLINASNLSIINARNQLYSNKFNKETELINQDKLNRQAVADRNIAEYNAYKDRVIDFNNRKVDMQGENTIGLINGINSAVQDTIARRQSERALRTNAGISLAAYPNSIKYLLNTVPELRKILKVG